MLYAYTSYVDSQRCFRRRITVHHHNRNTTERVLCGGMYYTYSQFYTLIGLCWGRCVC